MLLKFIAKQKKGLHLIYGAEYRVLSVDFIECSEIRGCVRIKFRVMDENGTPGLYEPNLFEMVDSNIADDFIWKNYTGNSSFELLPKSMSYSGFWEDFFDDDKKAIEVFKTRFPDYNDKLF